MHWAPGLATGVGSLPGTDPGEATRQVFGELPGFPHLPELPARGPGADMIGRTAALLVELAVELTSTGWAFTGRPGRDVRRARSLLSADLDALEEVASGYQGPMKIQIVGPWTLAAAIELRNGEKALADPGAVRDLSSSLAEGLTEHAAEATKRVPGARLVVQIDEPSLPGVLAGGIRTVSGLRALAAVEPTDAVISIGTVRSAVPAELPVIVHCCAPGVPVGVVRRAGVNGVGFDFGLIDTVPEEELGTAIEAGLAVFAGAVPPRDTDLSALADTVDPVRQWWRRLGFAPERLAEQVVVTPACGLAGASPAYARRAMTRCREAARALYESPEG
ncbi:MAG TPA: methionine synthase [Actinomycetes bacterium]|nr:methionine synthase [Actinomycetes bacterium]